MGTVTALRVTPMSGSGQQQKDEYDGQNMPAKCILPSNTTTNAVPIRDTGGKDTGRVFERMNVFVTGLYDSTSLSVSQGASARDTVPKSIVLRKFPSCRVVSVSQVSSGTTR